MHLEEHRINCAIFLLKNIQPESNHMRKQSDKSKFLKFYHATGLKASKISVSRKTACLPPQQKVLGSISREKDTRETWQDSIKGHTGTIHEILVLNNILFYYTI